MSSLENILFMLKEQEIQFIDLRFTDLLGKEHHLTISSSEFQQNNFSNEGKIFDASSLKGWKNVDDSDMILKPILNSAIIDPFFEEKTLAIRCDIFESDAKNRYIRDPRAIAQNAEHFLTQSEIADCIYFGSEPEFFLFDDIRFTISPEKSLIEIDEFEASWNKKTKFENGNKGFGLLPNSGYSPLSPLDSMHDLRTKMCLFMQQMGLKIEAHHHEVATGQNEISFKFNSLTKKADETQIYKYVVKNTANLFNKTATFLPKPLFGENGSGMHCHQSLFKNGKNLFHGECYAGLSETALFYIGGIIKHAKAINAFTNPTTNSYKRLVPGFEAPTSLAFSAKNRSAGIRIPLTNNPNAKRIEVRFPDPAANPYLAFSAQLMAGIDGIKNKIEPGNAIEKNLYEMNQTELNSIGKCARSLDDALESLNLDRDFLLQGNVFSHDLIDAYIQLKKEEIKTINQIPNPAEFAFYYQC